jgi:hypothetical protein
MSWSEIGDGAALDQLKPTWSIPQERMKMGVVHDVPLSDCAVEIRRAARPAVGGQLRPASVRF